LVAPSLITQFIPGFNPQERRMTKKPLKLNTTKARKLVLEIDNPSKLWSMASKIAQKLCY
jgi:hypothetical protein